MNFLKKNLSSIMAVAGILSFVGAIILFIASSGSDGYKKVLGMICGILLVILAILIAYYLLLSRDTDPNFFLFDRVKKRNIAIENLTFATVNERMNFFLTLICESSEQLWIENILDDSRKFGPRGVYKPLVAYKMLYDLGEKDLDCHWELLRNAAPATIDMLCKALECGGEQQMVNAFRYIHENCSNDSKQMRDFICGNMRYIKGKMLAYVKRHIELFY